MEGPGNHFRLFLPRHAIAKIFYEHCEEEYSNTTSEF